MPVRSPLIITGASGFVAGFLIARLEKDGWPLVLVSRQPDRLQEQFPEHSCIGYAELAERAASASALIHLATRNSDAGGTLDDFVQANVTCLQECLIAVRRAGVCKVIYTSSLHAQEYVQDPYGRSKYQAEQLLAEITDMDVTCLRLAAVYADGQYRGKLSILHKAPAPLRPLLQDCLSALRPIVHERKVVDAICRALPSWQPGPRPSGSRFVTDAQVGNKVYGAGKRILDLSFALAVLGLFWWLLAGLWAAVRLTSPGSGIFQQTRLGRYQRPFKLLKFRTMTQGTSQVGTHEVAASAVTQIGAVLRRLKLDELPQAWNILRGQISLVGPRPCLPTQEVLCRERRKHGVFDIRPGLTGLGQVRGVDMSTPERLAEMDAEYIALRSLTLDVKLVLATFLGRGRGDPAQHS